MVNKLKTPTQKDKLEGFSGWLAFFGFTLFLAPFRVIFELLNEFKGLTFTDIISNKVLTIAILEISLILVGYCFLIIIMIRRNKNFKYWFLGIQSISLIFDTMFLVLMSSSLEMDISDTFAHNLGSAFYIIIWSLYLWNSERSKNTFIN